jgi:pullulanase/glycogen debranching enzyme
MTRTLTMTEGRPAPLGATFDGEGVNFAVFSEHATRISVCIFSEDGKTETIASTCRSAMAMSGTAMSRACVRG